MFRGATKVTLDDKGRMVMPTRYREQISVESAGKLVVTIDVATDDRERCLLIYPASEWDKTESKLMSLPTLHPKSRKLQRLMVGHAADVDLDGHGRFLLSQELRDFAGLQKVGMLIGQGKRFELWDETRWNEQRDEWLKSEETLTDLPPDLDSLSY
jgi:MraZ protein